MVFNLIQTNSRRIILTLITLCAMASCQAKEKSELKNGITAKEIVSKISKKKPTVYKDCIITGKLDFTKVNELTVVGSGHLVAEIDIPIVFINCIFLDSVTSVGTYSNAAITTRFLKQVVFEDCDFRNSLNMENSLFEYTVNFAYSIFQAPLALSGSQFNGGQIYLNKITAKDRVNLQNCRFQGDLFLNDSHFDNKLSLQESVIENNLFASTIESSGLIDLSMIRVDGRTLLNYLHTSNSLLISNSQFKAGFEFIESTVDGSFFFKDNMIFKAIKLNNTKVSDLIDLSGSLFIGQSMELKGFTSIKNNWQGMISEVRTFSDRKTESNN